MVIRVKEREVDLSFCAAARMLIILLNLNEPSTDDDRHNDNDSQFYSGGDSYMTLINALEMMISMVVVYTFDGHWTVRIVAIRQIAINISGSAVTIRTNSSLDSERSDDNFDVDAEIPLKLMLMFKPVCCLMSLWGDLAENKCFPSTYCLTNMLMIPGKEGTFR